VGTRFAITVLAFEQGMHWAKPCARLGLIGQTRSFDVAHVVSSRPIIY
jgi:hypothetical protein